MTLLRILSWFTYRDKAKDDVDAVQEEPGFCCPISLRLSCEFALEGDCHDKENEDEELSKTNATLIYMEALKSFVTMVQHF